MTVDELIEQLKKFSSDLPICDNVGMEITGVRCKNNVVFLEHQEY